MTPREAASLLMIGFEGTQPSEDLRAFFAEGPPAGVILFERNIESRSQLEHLLRELRSLWPAGAPTPAAR